MNLKKSELNQVKIEKVGIDACIYTSEMANIEPERPNSIGNLKPIIKCILWSD